MRRRKGRTLLAAYREGMADEAKGGGYTLASVLHYHFIAAGLPPGSDEWRKCIEEAHRVFLLARADEKARRSGRRAGSKADDPALGAMWVLRHHFGVRRARELARAVIEMGLVPVAGTTDARRIDRLARKYNARAGKSARVSKEWVEGYRLATAAIASAEAAIAAREAVEILPSN
jgi:hypothetical protein